MRQPLLQRPRNDDNLACSLWAAAHTRGSCPAIIANGATVTYTALRDGAANVAAALGESGVEAGDRVAIFMERGAPAAAAIMGVMAAGAAAVVINDRFRPRQIEYVLRHSGARALVTATRMLERQPRAIDTDATMLLHEALTQRSGARVRPTPRMPDDLAQIIYTSGSTGLPKGVAHTHGSLSAGVRSCIDYLGLRSGDRLASLLPFSSVYGLNQLLSSIAVGSSLVVVSHPVPQEIVARLAEAEVTVVAGVPPLWTQLATAPRFRQVPLPALRMMQNAGGHLPARVARALREAQPDAALILQYGMTETFRSTYLPPALVDAHPTSIGGAVPGAEILVVREDLTPCAPGELGELVHRGPSIALGYWNEPAATAAVFRSDPRLPPGSPDAARVVFSGDMVRMDHDGLLYFVSRRDQLIKTLGFRVGPDEIADVLLTSGEVAECVVTSRDDDRRGDRIIAFVVLSTRGSRRRLEQFARAELPRYMWPSEIAVLDALPRLAGGKYDLRALSATASQPI